MNGDAAATTPDPTRVVSPVLAPTWKEGATTQEFPVSRGAVSIYSGDAWTTLKNIHEGRLPKQPRTKARMECRSTLQTTKWPNNDERR